jgi:hypothetical protein
VVDGKSECADAIVHAINEEGTTVGREVAAGDVMQPFVTRDFRIHLNIFYSSITKKKENTSKIILSAICIISGVAPTLAPRIK